MRDWCRKLKVGVNRCGGGVELIGWGLLYKKEGMGELKEEGRLGMCG